MSKLHGLRTGSRRIVLQKLLTGGILRADPQAMREWQELQTQFKPPDDFRMKVRCAAACWLALAAAPAGWAHLLAAKPGAWTLTTLPRVLPPSPLSLQVVDVSRTCKGTSTGGLYRYSCMVVVGNGNGVLGWGQGKAAEVNDAVQKVRRASADCCCCCCGCRRSIWRPRLQDGEGWTGVASLEPYVCTQRGPPGPSPAAGVPAGVPQPVPHPTLQ